MLNQRILVRLGERGINPPKEVAEGAILSDLLLDKERITLEQARLVLEEATGVTSIDPLAISFSQEFLERIRLLIPRRQARDEQVFPFKHQGNVVHVIMANPLDEGLTARLEALTNARVKPYVFPTGGIVKAVDRYYPEEKEEKEPEVSALREMALQSVQKRHLEGHPPAMELANDIHVLRLLQRLLQQEAGEETSDLHFESLPEGLRLRSRRIGVLREVAAFPPLLGHALLARVKLIAGLNPEPASQPLDGRIDYHVVAGRELDFRVSVLPANHGEKAVLRLLDKGKKRPRLEDMGLVREDLARIRKAVSRPNGLFLVTGPTGSGKSTTLFACLEARNEIGVAISTLEDPVEYTIPGVTQVNCNAETGVTFAAALRSLLRQDPDIIMVGEIRDGETADMAVKAALTGHLVLSTLHTNDAASAVTRLVNLNVAPFLIASCNLTVAAQRLIRTNCPHCRVPLDDGDPALRMLGVAHDTAMPLQKGAGCTRCHGSGYGGRAAIVEVLEVDAVLEGLILAGASSGQIKEAAVAQGMITLRQAALAKLREGLTTPEEVLRVTLED